MSCFANWRVALSLTIALGGSASLWAELPSPLIDVVTPVGMSAGTELEVTLQGADLERLAGLRFDHPGLSAQPVPDQPLKFRIRAAADVPTGTYDLIGTGPLGITNARPFAVTNGLPDVPEAEPNNVPTEAQTLTVNAVVNGVFDGNGQDLFRVPLRAGQRVVIDCQTARLGTDIDAQMTLRGADGRTLGASSDYIGRDPLIDYLATSDEEVLLEVSDLTYRGGQPYRLVVTDHPWVENAFPPVLPSQGTATVTLLGRNLGNDARPTSWRTEGPALDEATITLGVPTDVWSERRYLYQELPVHHSVLPTAATCTLTGVQLAVRGGPAQTFLVDDRPLVLEQEPNNTRDAPQKLTLPALVAGRFQDPRDADWYSFETGTEGGKFAFDVYSERIAGRADPALAILDAAGNRISELDDFGHRIGAFDGHLRDPAGSLDLAPNQTYRVVVLDRYQRGGPRLQYVLSIRRAVPDVFIAAIATTDQQPAGLNLRQGGSVALQLAIHRREGQRDPISIEAEGLPPGVTAPTTTVPSDERAWFILTAAEDAPLGETPIRLIATLPVNGQTVRREVRPYQRMLRNVGSAPIRQLVLSVQPKSPFAVRTEPALVPVVAGNSAEFKLVAQRYWPDFKGAINYQPQQWNGEFQLSSGNIGEGQSEVTVRISVREGTPPGRYTLPLIAQAQVPYNKNLEATERPMTLVTVPVTTVTFDIQAPPAKP